MKRETIKDEKPSPKTSEQAAPGVVLVFSGGAACFHVVPLLRGALELGRDDLAALHLSDARVSRQHLGLRLDGSCWTFTDRGSTNGVFLDGKQLQGTHTGPSPRVVRIGKTLLLPVSDVTPYVLHGVSVTAERIVGPSLRQVLDQIAKVGRLGQNVLITGPSGAGKELAARAFHDAAASRGKDRPFVALNCATIPEGLAERILFGAKRGAYSGADSDAKGLVQAAGGGTLFLDEIGDLDAAIQTKLLRVLETREVLPVGATQPTAVEFSLCAATHKDLRDEVTTGRFREDLYFRIGRPELRLPSLAERPEEIPWLAQRAIEAVGLGARPDAELIEQCLLRPWPGNVRELLAGLRSAAIAASGEELVLLSHLASTAGVSLRRTPVAPREPDAPLDPIEEALRKADGNVSQAATALGMSRAKVRRFIEKSGLDVAAMKKG